MLRRQDQPKTMDFIFRPRIYPALGGDDSPRFAGEAGATGKRRPTRSRKPRSSTIGEDVIGRQSSKKVALVHEFFVQYGGAERVFEALAELFPNAQIYTLVYDPARFGDSLAHRNIKTSFIQNLPFGVAQHRGYFFLMPKAVEFFDLKGYDLVISDSSSFVKGVITYPPTVHICYCHTPTRFIWQEREYYLKTAGIPKIALPVVRRILDWMKDWDFKAAQRPDYLIANSKTVRERIRRFYHRDSVVIYPFVNAERFSIAKQKGAYFLMGGRLVPYKRYDIVIEAFNQLNEKLLIIGDGYGRPELVKLVKKTNIEFLGRVPDTQLRSLYNKARAYIFPAEEDFGITPLEAMASGTPVIAYGQGGATETVVEGKTGLFFGQQTPQAVTEAIRRFETMTFNPAVIRRQALSFSRAHFMLELRSVIEQSLRHRSPNK